MHDVVRQFLAGFDMLTGEEVDIIVENTNIRHYKKGDLILREGQMAKECYMVLKGLVREYYIVDGEEKTTNFFTELQPVNSFSSRKNKIPSRHFLVCAEDCAVTVSTNSLEAEMCRLIPRLQSIIRDAVEKETGKMQDDMAKFITSSPEDLYKDLVDNRADLLNRVPQHQIASYIGVKPETLSRIRKRLLTTTK